MSKPTVHAFDHQLFSYHIDKVDGGGLRVLLTRTRDEATKEFFLAAPISIEKMAAHMESLTPDQCGHFFPDGKTKNTGKKSAAAPPKAAVAASEVATPSM